MASRSANKSFAEATDISALSSHTYSAHFPEDWCIGSVPHGGYVTSCFLRVASLHFSTTLAAQNQPHTITLHLDFLRRTHIGPALFKVQDTKIGRQTSVINIALSQNGREEVVGYLTNSNMTTESGISHSTNYALIPPPAPVNLSLLDKDKDLNWVLIKDLPFTDFRRASTKILPHYPRLGQRGNGSADEWVRLASGEKWTNASIGYISDMWPIPVDFFLSMPNARPKTPYWYPTLLLNLDIKKALPDNGVDWLFVRVNSKQIKNGRLDIEVVILDEGGEIIALSHHVTLILSSARNVAPRRLRSGDSKI